MIKCRIVIEERKIMFLEVNLVVFGDNCDLCVLFVVKNVDDYFVCVVEFLIGDNFCDLFFGIELLEEKKLVIVCLMDLVVIGVE